MEQGDFILEPKIITIDGLSSSGKSTVADQLAGKLKWAWFSTGVIYRGLAFIGNQEGWKFPEDERLYRNLVDSDIWKVKVSVKGTDFFYKNTSLGKRIYNAHIDTLASVFSAHSELRKALLPIQRKNDFTS